MYVHNCAWVADIRGELRPRLLLWALMSSSILTLACFITYGASMSSLLLDNRANQHQARVEKMGMIIQSAQASLLTANEKSTSNKQVYQDIAASVDRLLNRLGVVYSFSLIDLCDISHKYGPEDPVPTTDWEKYVAEQIKSKDASLVLLEGEGEGNLSIAQLISFQGVSFCGLVRLSGRSLSNVLNLTSLKHRMLDFSHEKIPAHDDAKMLAYGVPVDGALSIIYWQPDLSVFSVTTDITLANIRVLVLVSAIFLMLFGLFYAVLASMLQRYYRVQLQKQDSHISIISKELDESSAALVETRDEVAAYRTQKLAFSKLMAIMGAYTNHSCTTTSSELAISVENPSVESITMEELAGIVVKCFEVTRFKNKIHLKFISSVNWSSLPMDNWLLVVILYNLFHRAFCRANNGTTLEVKIGGYDALQVLEVQDHGYPLGPDHSSYFSDRTGMNGYLLDWSVLMTISEKKNMALEHIKIDQETTRVILSMKANTDTDSKKGPSNVIPLRR